MESNANTTLNSNRVRYITTRAPGLVRMEQLHLLFRLTAFLPFFRIQEIGPTLSRPFAMKSFITVILAPALVAASPIEKRQTGTVAKEFSRGGCADNIFIFSRGSTEAGNMVHRAPNPACREDTTTANHSTGRHCW